MYTLEEVKVAYYKLKNYAYYDNTGLFLREKLIEFETDTKKDDSNDFKDIFDTKQNTIEQNLKQITSFLLEMARNSCFKVPCLLK